MKYLKPRQEYIDRYDRITVRRCRWVEKAISGHDIQKHSKENLDEASLVRMTKAFNELHLWFAMGESYAKKEEVISQWIRKDEERDQFYEAARSPQGIKCLVCEREMFVSYKYLETNLDKPDRVIFMYDCTLGHLPRRTFYENGEEWKYDNPICSKCKSQVEQVSEDTEEKFRTVFTCKSCGNVEVTEIERTANKVINDLEYEKDRARFCSDEEGRKYVDWINTAKELGELMDKKKEKEQNKDLYDRVEKLKKLSIPQVKQHILDALKDQKYLNLTFEQPRIERIVSIGFGIEDPTEQNEHNSCTKLRRFFNRALEGTNWRLMSEGLSYRLGLLTGRIRVYEKEEDLVKLVISATDKQ